MTRLGTMRLFIALGACGELAGAAATAAPKQKVILDTDIGDDIDDAWALAFALAHPDFDLVGVTAAHGNTPGRAKIALKMLHQTGRDDVPVAVGRKTNDHAEYQFTWAEDFTARAPIATPAADFIVEKARKHPGEITLVAVGPLENVADAIRKEPKLGKLLRRVVLMSGCVTVMSGGRACKAEYNVAAAAKDAQLVYSTLPLTIVPLDSTTHVVLQQPERERLKAYRSPLTHAVESLYRLWIDRPDNKMTLHDQLAVVETSDPGTYFGKREVMNLVVDDKGFTRVDAQKGKPVTVCLEPKRDAFMSYYIDRLVGQRLGMPGTN